MKTLLTTLTISAMILLPLTHAESDETKKTEAYDLPAVIQTALENHPSLRGASAQVDAARAQLDQAKAGYSPKLGATLGFTELQDAPSFTMSPFGTVVFGERDNKQASLMMQLPVFTGGKLEGANRQARAGLHASESSLERQRQRVVLDATVAYFNVLKARNLVKVVDDQLKALESQRDAIDKMVQRGVATRVDLLRSQTSVAAAQEGLTRAKNGEAIALAALANAMGVPVDPALKVVASERPAYAYPGDLKSAVGEAMKSRPELRQLEANRKAARAGIDVAQSNQRPSLGLFAQYDAKRPTFMPETGKWSAGVALTMNLFDGGATRADVARARAEVIQVESAMDELRNGISLQVTQSFLNVQSAKDRVKTTEEGVAAAEEGMRLVKLGYQNGVNTITDYLAAQADLTKAHTDRVVALFDRQAAEAELQYAMGREK